MQNSDDNMENNDDGVQIKTLTADAELSFIQQAKHWPLTYVI